MARTLIPSPHFTTRLPSKPHHKPPIFRVHCSNSNLETRNSNRILSLLAAVADWADEVKERRARDRRPLYSQEVWREHRGSRRHLRHLLSSLSSRVILSLVPPVSALTAIAAALAAYNAAASSALLPPFLPVLRASPLPYQLTAPALALLLVFRTEASYSRFEEGRKAWMRVIAGAGELVGLAMHGCRGGDDAVKRALVNYILAFPIALKCHIISGSDIRNDLQGLLEEDDLDVVLRSKHRPHCIIEFISQSLQMLDFEEQNRYLMESKISSFHEGIGVCEQLIGIPIPLSYTRLTSRFLVLWHLTLPVVLWDECQWIVIPATFISAASLFSIEEVGVLIEEPFPMLALDELCEQLQDSIQDVMAVQSSVRKRLVAKRKGHSGGRPVNGWPAPRIEQGKND